MAKKMAKGMKSGKGKGRLAPPFMKEGSKAEERLDRMQDRKGRKK